jgi:hypothetical protein
MLTERTADVGNNMDLTSERKDHIDAMDYEGLLRRWRHAPFGDEWFHGETGVYWQERMCALRDINPHDAVQASKRIGWK